ncbi:piwi-like protein 1 [Pholidichthys leucotaenia]
MSGPARARSRGRARGQEPAPPGPPREPAPVPAPPQPLPAEGDLGGRGRQKGVPGPFTEEAMIEISGGFQMVKLGERGGRRRDFHDDGINTRQAMAHVKDSKTGTSGSRISLTANFFRIVSRPQWVLYQYHVDFNPPMESRKLRAALLYQHDDTLGPARSFDGGLLFLPHRLQNKETMLCSSTRSGEKVRIKVTLTNELPPTSPVCLHFYNILFRRVLRILNMQQIGRNYYNPSDPLEIPRHRLTIWPGYSTTILKYESSIMMCSDVSHKVLRSETVLDYMTNLKPKLGSRFTEVCSRELADLIVLTKYNNKTYRIFDIAWDHTPNNTFRRGETDISFANYYKTQYGLEITDGAQVLLVSKVKKRLPDGRTIEEEIMLVPEFCFLTGLTDQMRKDVRMMRDFSEHIRLTPEQREGRLNKFMSTIQNNADAQAELDMWGLTFDRSLLNIEGRLLEPEYLYQKGAKVIEFEERSDNLLRLLHQNVDKQTQMVVVVLPSWSSDLYASVKKQLCVQTPVPSQCVLASTINKPKGLMTVATKLALQMACKIGGELWSVEIPLKHLMIVGIDVYHSTSSKRSSVAALVASLNHSMSRWFSKCMRHQPGQEIMDKLKKTLIAALKEYLKLNGELPARIIIYRDGVGDGQLHSVVSYELEQIHDAIKYMGRDYKPRLGVVVVKKRTNCRLFYHNGGMATNPLPGTVVDTEITRQEWYDFYIVSQAVRTGSVSPTHYNIVYDTTGLKPDHMQRLTYKLCHMYYNWQGVVAVPAPCLYAHKLAYLVGDHISNEPSPVLEDYLFYL